MKELTDEELNELSVVVQPIQIVKLRKSRVKKEHLNEIISYITYLEECPYPKLGQVVYDKLGIRHEYLGKNKWLINLKIEKEKQL